MSADIQAQIALYESSLTNITNIQEAVEKGAVEGDDLEAYKCILAAFET